MLIQRHLSIALIQRANKFNNELFTNNEPIELYPFVTQQKILSI